MSKGRNVVLLGLVVLVAAGTYGLLIHFDPLSRVEPTVAPPPKKTQPVQALPEPEPKPTPLVEPAPALEAPPSLPSPPKKPRVLIRPKPKPIKEEPAPVKAVMTVRDTTPPELALIEPLDRSLSREARIPIRVRAEAGGRVEVGRIELREQAGGLFSGVLELKRGPNSFTVTAKDAVGNNTKKTLRVTYVDPKIERSQKRIGVLLGKISEVKTLAVDLDKQSAELVARIDTSADVDLINKLSHELRELRNNRRELAKEIDQAMDHLDHLTR